MPIPIKELVRMENGSYAYYEAGETTYEYIMRNAKSYAHRAHGVIWTEKIRGMSANHDNVITLVKVTVIKQGKPRNAKGRK